MFAACCGDVDAGACVGGDGDAGADGGGGDGDVAAGDGDDDDGGADGGADDDYHHPISAVVAHFHPAGGTLRIPTYSTEGENIIKNQIAQQAFSSGGEHKHHPVTHIFGITEE